MTNDTKDRPQNNDVETVIEAGRLLMESGAEIYRIEETMQHMATQLHIEKFEAYVVNRGIMASCSSRNGSTQAKIANVPNVGVHLGKLEAVNALSREIETNEGVSADEINRHLKIIRDMPDVSPLILLLSYMVGGGFFSYAVGSPISDSLCSALTGLVMGIVMYFSGKIIHTRVLLTMLGSAVVSLCGNLMYAAGFGEHRGFIILGALMLLVPGAAFGNSVREFSQNNYASGLTLLMSALLTCLSISVGVALTTELLPFAEQMTTVFSNTNDSFTDITLRAVSAGIGTIAFSAMFHTPKRYYLDLGVLGALSWALYRITCHLYQNEAAAAFIPALFVALGARLLSAKRKCPMTIFLLTSMLPLLPGLSLYRAVYFLLTGSDRLAYHYLRSCFISAFAIAVAIMLVQQIPRRHRKGEKI